MTRPSVREPGEVTLLSDAEAPDFLDAHEVALLAFLDLGDDASLRMRQRLALVVAKLARPGFGAGVVDVTRHRLVAEAVGVKSVPMTLVFVRGEVVDRLIGSPPEPVLEDVVRARLPP